jgi:hypothetical protein
MIEKQFFRVKRVARETRHSTTDFIVAGRVRMSATVDTIADQRVTCIC